MTINWEQIIGELGVAAVLAVFFYLLLRAYVQRTGELLEDKRLAERTLIETTAKAAESATGFLNVTNDFNHTAEAFTVTMSNHLVHSELAFQQQTEALKELTMAIDKMCVRLEVSKDHQRG